MQSRGARAILEAERTNLAIKFVALDQNIQEVLDLGMPAVSARTYYQ